MKRKNRLLVVLISLVIWSFTHACFGVSTTTSTQQSFASPKQLLIDYEGVDVVAIVQIQGIENRWTILEDGDHLPIKHIRCKMVESIRSNADWPRGAIQNLAHLDYTNLLDQPISPPPIVGRYFLLWANSTKEDQDTQEGLEADYWAHPQGLFLIRDSDSGQYFYWNKKSYSIDNIRQHEKRNHFITLDQIIDPLKRIEIARNRLKENIIDDVDSFIEGLILNIRNPGRQSRYIEKIVEAEPTDDFLNFRKEINQFKLWYESLIILKELGQSPAHKQRVVASLRPLVSHSNKHTRLIVSIILADFNNTAGRQVLEGAFRSEAINLSKDPDGSLSLPGRIRYDNSSVAASSYALGLLGDNRGLNHKDIEVKLAAADGLSTNNPANRRC